MRFQLLFFVAFFGLHTISAQKMSFIKENLKKAQKVAAKDGKPIFVDAYTTWCGPCKWMDANTFKDPEVAKFMNTNYVNLKLDMESGDGIEFAKKYKVQGYPTFLYIDAAGKVLHQGIGVFTASKFLALGAQALNPQKRLSFYADNYASKKSDSEFLFDYANLLNELRSPSRRDIANEYLASKSNWNDEATTNFIFKFVGIDIDEKLFQYMLKNLDSFYKYIPGNKVDEKVINGIVGYLGPNSSADEIQQELISRMPKHSQRLVDKLYLDELMSSDPIQDISSFANMAFFFASHYEVDDWEYLNSIAWIIYEEGLQTSDFEKGKEIALLSVRANSNYYNNDTVAALYYMLKDKGQATSYAKRAIELANESSVNPASTLQLLKMIEQL